MGEAAKIGRPVVEIDWRQFLKLCRMQATLLEIAAWFDCTPEVIERAVKSQYGKTFAEVHGTKRQHGYISLRRRQFQVAMHGAHEKENANVTMLIWLGKQWLGQRDRPELSILFGRTDEQGKPDDVATYIAQEERGLQQTQLATRGIIQLAMAKKAGSGNGSEPEGGASAT